MDTRRELQHINAKGYRWFSGKLGEGVVWHEFDGSISQYHDTYDDGGRRYRRGILLLCLWVIPGETPFTPMAEGRKSFPTIRLALSLEKARTSGLSNPEDFDRHLNDCFVFEGAVWDVNSYAAKGRLDQNDIVIGVEGVKSYTEEERIFDTMPESITHGQATRPVSYPNQTDQNFPDHELPAANTDTPEIPSYGQDPLYDDPG